MQVARRTRFGDKLRRELDSRKLSVRKLGRLIDADRPESARRNLVRWIGGHNQPSRIHRIAVAEALGLPADHFFDDDDEEPDPMVDLMRAIRRVVQDELAKERT